MWKPRPYDPTHCQRILEFAANGLERAQLAVALAVSEQDLAAWAEAHDEFAIALADAASRANAWFQDQHLKALQGNDTGRANAWTKAMAHRRERSTNVSRRAQAPPERPKVKVRYEIPDNGKEPVRKR